MDLLVVIFIAFALAMDAFAVCLSAAAYLGNLSSRQRFRLSFHFGLFQTGMTMLGWIAGSTVVRFIQNYDHWVALGILGFIGIKMVETGIRKSGEHVSKDITKGLSLISLSVATSIDALAVGFSLGIIRKEVVLTSILIGLVAAGMSILGIILGEKLSDKFGDKISILGGVILILIGLNILREHLQLF